MPHLDIDVAMQGDETPAEAMEQIEREFDVTRELIDEHGSGGGWPVVRVTGPESCLQRVMEAWDL